jgi:AcrR family transcriptional regulator
MNSDSLIEGPTRPGQDSTVAGRPRSMDDSAILDAAARVMGRTGPAGLTLALIAAEVGLVPATLVQRFGSKRGLLLALSARTVAEVDAGAARVRAEHDSPLAALDALIVELWPAGLTPEEYANHLAFLCADLADVEARAHALAAHDAQDRATAALLAEAVDRGELRSDTEVTALTATVQAAVTGAGLLWSLDHRATLPARRREALDAALAPYLGVNSAASATGR